MIRYLAHRARGYGEEHGLIAWTTNLVRRSDRVRFLSEAIGQLTQELESEIGKPDVPAG